MATLATKPYLVASLNVLIAARGKPGDAQAFSNEEIVEILFAMVENNTVAPDVYSTLNANWSNNSNQPV